MGSDTHYLGFQLKEGRNFYDTTAVVVVIQIEL